MIIAEIQLELAATVFDLSAMHWWSEDNKVLGQGDIQHDLDQ